MSSGFEGKTVIVTGAARGVGRAIVGLLVERGAQVMMADGEEARLNEAAADLPVDKGGVARFACDLSQKFGVNNLVAATLDAYGSVDALITTATEFERGDPVTLSVDALDRVMAANLRSAFLLSQTVAKKMIARSEAAGDAWPGGAIVHVSALSGQLSSPEVAAHAISCASLDQLTRILAATLAPHRIRVNGVAPGGLLTEALKHSLLQHPDLRAALIARTPLARIGAATEAAEAALFLASQRASFVTGQVLTVDGGRSVLDPLAATNI